MKQILTTFLLLFSLTISAQTVDVVGPKKKSQTTAPAKPKPTTPAAKPQQKQQTTTVTKPKQQTQHKVTQPKQPSISTPTGYENGHGYVDLGLSVKWATMNVGASSPIDYGGYYAWGETEPKSTYTWANLKYCIDSSYNKKFSKYVTSSSYGTVDNMTTLDLADDAAYKNWGGSWRMPTRAEQVELCNRCNWKWTIQNGFKGYMVTSKLNGKSIFLPAAGHYSSDFYHSGSGTYWSSSLHPDHYSDYACYLSFYFDIDISRNHVGDFVIARSNGQSVRPVCP